MASRRDGSRDRDRVAAGVVLAGVAVAVGLLIASMACYPGGTWMDRHTRGYDLARNFLCDLISPVALDGEPNPVGAALGPVGMLLLVGVVGVFWQVLPGLFAEGWVRVWGRG